MDRAGAPALRAGPRLRGEPEPAPVPRPERAYRWISAGILGMGATITVVAGIGIAELLAAFRAGPPEPLTPLLEQFGIEPWVAVGEVAGGVLAVEPNGWQGTAPDILGPLSAGGRAAANYWNVDAVRTLAFARAGRVVESFEWVPPGGVSDTDVAAALDGIDLDHVVDRTERNQLAVERFTGVRIVAADVDRILGAGVAHRLPAPT